MINGNFCYTINDFDEGAKILKAVGVIVEYNPFHNGHAFHVNAARETANAEIVIAVMSGNFLQRGEPALVSKWYRTRMALQNGVDLVFELPYRFAVQKAETFANGAISILDAAGCDSICFGSESGEISSFYQTIHFLETHKDLFNENVKQFVSTGVSYPKAMSLAFESMRDTNDLLDLTKPNNILGFQYVQAIYDQNSSLKALTVPRKNANYHDEHFASETIASATSIRKAIFANKNEKPAIAQYVPETTKNWLDVYYQHYGMFHQWESYWPYLQFRLIQAGAEELQEIYEMEEGLEHRLKGAALESFSFQDFMNKVKTKRYTWTRLQRLCVHILTNAQKKDMAKMDSKAGYLRLLGMTEAGKSYLNQHKKHLDLPVISKLASFNSRDILLDVTAARVYSLALKNPVKMEMLLQEYKQPPLYMK